ncbi:MAG: EscU/YscU/HrcU family type III secretion system export apparatus switch protein [Bryobacteraceae bacterium]
MADQKTEQPTQQRLQKARREGKFASSRDLYSTVQFVLAFSIALRAGEQLYRQMRVLFTSLIERAFSPAELTSSEARILYSASIWPVLKALIEDGALVAGAALFVHLASTGFSFAGKQVLPDPTRINPGSRLKQMPQQNWSALIKSALLLPIIAAIVYAEVSYRLPELANLELTSLGTGLIKAREMMVHLLWRISLALLVLAGVDYAKQRRRFTSGMRMTKHEIKDEVKENEGNPQMKMRIRRLQREAARKSMMKAIPKATAVVVNPTHYAVALQYEMNSKSIPMVVAKGKNYLALLIRQRAIEHEVPIIENQPLAQALYQAADVGQEIPAHLYRAVAEVLAYIYRTLSRR